MAVDTQEAGKLIQRFEYPWKNKWFDGPLIYFFVTLLVGQIFAYSEYGVEGRFDDLVATWLMAGGIALALFFMAWREILIHQPIEVFEKGIRAVNIKKKNIFWGFPKRNFLLWSQIEHVEAFAYPDWNSRKNNSGIKLWFKNRKIQIYEELESFPELLVLLQNNLSKGAILDCLIDRPPLGQQSGKIIGTYSYKFLARYFVVYAVVMALGMGIAIELIGYFRSNIKIDYSNLQPHQLKGTLIIWGVFGGMALVAFFMARRRYVLLQPIVLTEDGIKGPLNDRKHKYVWYWQEAASVFFRWSDIDAVERFYYDNDDIEAKVILGKEGFSLMAGLNRMAIFEHIHNFSEVESIIREKIPQLASSLDKN